jgi:peptidoglycan hydrolase-like protein with peptidoglycan-binding domain
MNQYLLKITITLLSSGLFIWLANSVPVFAQTATIQVFTLDLKIGSQNQQVTILQQLLAAESPDIYPEKMVSGYFGPLTQAAVKRFQAKYASEILIPAGVDSPTGFVGPFTRTKLNKVYIQLYHSKR